MQTLAYMKELLASRGLAPRKSMGQNFLIDANLARKLIDAADLARGDLVLEVGPGTGTMTEELLARGCVVVVCELDRGLARLLRETLGHTPPDRFRLVEGDCLESKHALSRELTAALAGRPFTLVANLPYGAATPLILTLLIDHPECRAMFVTVQKELADRLLAAPGSKDYGTLAVVARALAHVRRIALLGPECFWPRPEVVSAMISIRRRPDPMTEDPRRLADFCAEVFTRRRKQIGGVLGRTGPWPRGVQPTDRAEDLDVGSLIALSRTRLPV
jgi:16S rRNA (adenine1518-N6/adenine1519-N6)-dimethyltransferase